MKLTIKIIDDTTIHVSNVVGFQSKPDVLVPGQRHESGPNPSFQLYETLRELAETGSGDGEYEVKQVYHILKEYVSSTDIIEVGPWNPHMQRRSSVKPGGRADFACGGLSYEELAVLPDGSNYVEGHY